MIVERTKHIAHNGRAPIARYFWRTFTQLEIDYVEEREGRILAYEFKWNTAKPPSVPRTFTDAYHNATFTPVSPPTAFSFVTGL